MFINNRMPFWKGYYMAPDGAGGGAGAEGAGNAAGAEENHEGGKEGTLSFDDFLASESTIVEIYKGQWTEDSGGISQCDLQ